MTLTDDRPRRRPVGRRAWRIASTGLGGLGIAAAVVGFCSRYIRSQNHVIILGAAGAPYLSALGVLGAIVLALGGRRRIALAAAVVALATATPQIPLFVGGKASTGGPKLVVMTANLRLGLADPKAVVALVRKHAVQVLMLQELTPQEVQRLKDAGLETYLPNSLVEARSQAAGVGIWSAYPMTQQQRYGEFYFASMSARISIDGREGPLVATAHPAGPWPQSAITWSLDMSRMPAWLKTLDSQAGPSGLVMGGDFNATYDSAEFRHVLSGDLSDAVEQSGAGLIPTWPANRWYPPLVGIDHLIVAKATSGQPFSVEIPGSDHRGLISTISLPKSD